MREMSRSLGRRADLRPFSPSPQCPVCHGGNVDTSFHPEGVLDRDAFCWYRGGSSDDHLCRMCLVCRHTWSEYTADDPRNLMEEQ